MAASPLTPAATERLEPLLLPEPEARRMLGHVSAKTMYNLRKRHELPFVRLGSRIMYTLGGLKSFVERQKGGSHV